MKRRDWLQLLGASTLGASLPGWAQPPALLQSKRKGSFSLDGTRLRFYHPDIKQAFQTVVIADTHLFRDDDRGIPYQSFSGRMAKAYNQTQHYLTGEATNPEKSLVAALHLAADKKAALVALIGDIVSFPSEAAVDFVLDKMKIAGLPYVYTAGNHDWHYEGMPGSISALRSEWIQKRLLPLYQQQHPLMQVKEIQGVRMVILDNSNYEITAEQLAFLNSRFRPGNLLYCWCIFHSMHQAGPSVLAAAIRIGALKPIAISNWKEENAGLKQVIQLQRWIFITRYSMHPMC